MSAPIKVMPCDEDAVGLVHPLDGPLAAEGSAWTHDQFTQRLLVAGTIRRFEEGVDDAPVKTVGGGKAPGGTGAGAASR